MTQDSNASSYGRENAVKRAVSKSSHFYKNTTWDLVDASEDKAFELAEIDEKQLPAELQGKTLAEKESFIAEKAQEREQLKNEINELNSKRELYVQERMAESGEEEMLDKVMVKVIKAQAEAKKFEFR